MNHHSSHPATRLGARALALAGLCLLLRLPSAVWADSIYNYTVNTAAISGLNGYLAFDLVDGDGLGNNTVTASGFSTDGTLADASNVILANATAFDEVQRGITFGSYLHFSLRLTENFASGFPDEFSFFFLDSTGLQSLVSTSDPLGADALLVVDIDGNPGGIPSAYDSRDGSHSLVVPEGGSTLSLLLLALGAAGCRGLKRTRPAQPLPA